MEQQPTHVNDTQFAVVTAVYNGNRYGKFDAQRRKLMPYKAAASYAVKIIEDPKNYTFTAWATPMWREFMFNVRIFDDAAYEVVTFGWKASGYFDAISGIADLYAAAMYVIAAMREARARVNAIGQQEMTPAEIEREFGLSRGTVRKYIFDNREQLLETGVIRQADKRTILCKRGWAICRWEHKQSLYYPHWNRS